ncbi:MAG: hypothetical protein ACI9E1_001753 [Cryomorphaceae bacterium]|jgi:hypothetical protein
MKLIVSRHLNQEFAGQVGGKWCSSRAMNSSSILLCFVFAAIGYVIHPMILPGLVDAKVVAESALSDSYKEEQAKKSGKDLAKPEDDKIEDLAPAAVKPEVVELPTPVIPEPVIPEPVIPTPAPVTKPAPVDEGVKLSEQEFIDVLKASVKAGDVNEFEFSQVLEWKLAGEDGANQVGMVTYKADTIFDEQQLEAKALVKDGKVVKWLWPTTNTKMR